MLGKASAYVLALALSAAAPTSYAQEPAQQGAVLTLDPERLFVESRFGKAAIARLEAAQEALLAENKTFDAALEAEEKALTDRRASLPPDEFRALADAFNIKAEEIRAARLAKSRSLTALRDEDRQKFLAAIVPILGELMAEMGALVILDKKSVFLSYERIDVTDRAIARIDGALDDALLPEVVPPAP